MISQEIIKDATNRLIKTYNPVDLEFMLLQEECTKLNTFQQAHP